MASITGRSTGESGSSLAALSTVRQALGQVAGGRERLVLVVGAPSTGKTSLLQQLSVLEDCVYLNLSLKLADALADTAPSAMGRMALATLHATLAGQQPGVVCLDNIELLFHPWLRLDVLKGLRQASRERTLVVAWPGTVEAGYLTYAVPGHPEYARYGLPGITYVLLQ